MGKRRKRLPKKSNVKQTEKQRNLIEVVEDTGTENETTIEPVQPPDDLDAVQPPQDLEPVQPPDEIDTTPTPQTSQENSFARKEIIKFRCQESGDVKGEFRIEIVN